MISYLSLGSNQGDKKANLEKALDLLKRIPEIQLLKVSSYYETEPWGGVEQDSFINIAVEIETSMNPHELLTKCQEIEYIIGRKRSIHWGPRTIDIDILTYQDQKIKTEKLTIPHPYMEEREFVLAPLREISPDLILPSGLAIQEKEGQGKIKKISF